MAKVPRFDPLGLPISLEWETTESAARSGGEFIKQGLGDIFSSTFELFGAHIAGSPETFQEQKGFSSKGSIENFQSPKSKSPEQVKKEQEGQHAKVFYNHLEEDRRNAQKATQTRALEDEARLEIYLPEDVKNEKLGLSRNYRAEHTQTAYHQVELRRVLKEEEQAAEKAQQQQETQEVAPQINYFMQQNMAGERQGGQHVFNAAG